MADEGLDVFRIVAGCGNNSAAARLLKKDPSRISRMITGLEKDYGTKLFDRNSKPFTLTESGLYLVNMLDNGLSTNQKLKRFVDERETKNISIGYAFPFSWNMLSDKINRIKQTDPDIMISVIFANKSHIRDLLFEKQLDLAILPDKLFFRDYRTLEIIKEYEWGVAVPEGVPVCPRRYVEPDDLRKIPLLIPGEETCVDAIKEWFGGSFRLIRADMYTSTEIMVGMINGGFGYAFTPKADLPTLTRYNISFFSCSPGIRTSLYVYTRRPQDMSEQLRTLLITSGERIR